MLFSFTDKKVSDQLDQLGNDVFVGKFLLEADSSGKKKPNDKTVGVIAVPAHDKLFCIFWGVISVVPTANTQVGGHCFPAEDVSFVVGLSSYPVIGCISASALGNLQRFHLKSSF